MTKKILPAILVLAICFVGFFSCSKSVNKNIDATKSYFPIAFGKYITYDVDSIYYGYQLDTSLTGVVDTVCVQYEVKSQMKYTITDTARDRSDDSVVYLMDVQYRHYDGDFWEPQGAVLFVKVHPDSIVVTQDGSQYTKMKFPVVNGYTWKGNAKVDIHNPPMAYLGGWNYVYQRKGLSFNNNLHNFDNTVTVMEDDESVNYPYVDSAVQSYRTYAKEVYAYNIGMVYKEWTHWTYLPNRTHCVSGYTVIMRAVDYN